MNIIVFDTETTSLNKPYCYNIGLTVFDTTNKTTLLEKDWVVEQVWHNLPLFESAYYAEKRKLYVSRLKGRTCKMSKWGNIMRSISAIVKNYDIQYVFAYNSSFDERVMEFNSDWYRTSNPFDTLPIIDIMGYVHKSIAFTNDFQKWCEESQSFTDSGNYSCTAENIYRYLLGDREFVEEHTALADSQIELEILLECADRGNLEIGKEYKVYRSVPRKVMKSLEVVKDGEIVFRGEYERVTIRNTEDGKKILLK